MGKRPFRILQVVGNMNRGGTETMLMNHYRNIDRDIVQFDFIVHGNIKGDYEEEIASKGGRVFHAPLIRPWSYAKYFRWLKRFYRERSEQYIAVHGHIQENTGFALYFAKKVGIKYRISSSHIAPNSLDYKFIFRKFAKYFLNRNVTLRLACGYDAGIHLYGQKEFIIFKNAIESDSFRYNEKIREKVRKELNIKEDEKVIGHVGRFNPQKNHRFIIDLFYEYYKTNKNSKLILVGSGNLINEVRMQTEKLGIQDKVIFAGNRSDVSSLLQAFDVFFMPSLYEGLPVSGIEAQAAGLPCVFSDTIDLSTDITGNVQFLSLKASKEKWCNAINKALNEKRKDTREKIIDCGYDVKENIKKLMVYYGIK